MRTSASVFRRRCAAAALSMFLPCAALAAASPSRFDALAAAAEADPALRLVFADDALGELVAANEAELAAASGRWQRGARDYVNRLRALRARLPAAARVAVLREPHGPVRLLVDDAQVMLTAPRLGQQRALEARVVERVCAARQCPEPAVAESPPPGEAVTPSPLRRAVVGDDAPATGEWSLGDRAPPMYSQPDGLHCVFGDTRHLRLKQLACERVVAELRLLEGALRGVLQRGDRVDWAALAVHGGTDGAGGRVSYGANGRYFDLGLPTLASAPEMVRNAVPWLQTRLRGQFVDLVIEAPERLAYRVPDTD